MASTNRNRSPRLRARLAIYHGRVRWYAAVTAGPVTYHGGPYHGPGAAVDGAHSLAREVDRGE